MPKQGTVTPINANDPTAGLQPIAGMRPGWFFNPTDRTILHQAKAGAPMLPVGTVPAVLGKVTYRTSDRSHTRIGWKLQTPEGRTRIVTVSQILDGSWADLLGEPRPVGAEARQAFAVVMSEEVRTAPEVPAVPVKGEDGGLLLPDADSQDLGYLRLGDPDEAAALVAWQRVMRLAMDADRTTLAVCAFFAGPIVTFLQSVPAHVLNLYGGGQSGKSSAQKVHAALMGDPTDAYKVFGSLSTTANALPEHLLLARYLPMAREEASAGGLTLKELRALISRILSGGRRDRMGRDGGTVTQIGSFHSIATFSSNESLLTPGQPESFASRMVELHGPFWPGADEADEAVALAWQYHGWPLHWAKGAGLFEAERIEEWRGLHFQLTRRLSSAEGGITRTLARVMAAWCVGAHLLGLVLGLPELGERCFEDALAELPRVVGDAAENNQSAGALLWEKLAGAVASRPRNWPDASQLTGQGSKTGAEDGTPPVIEVSGYWWYNGRTHVQELHVLKTTMDELAAKASIDTTVPGLSEWRRSGILRSTQGASKFTSKPPGETLRKHVPGMVYILNIGAARDAYSEAPILSVVPEEPEAPADDSPIARSERAAAGGPLAGQARPEQLPEPVPTATSSAVAIPPRPIRPAAVFPPLEREVTDPRWDTLTKAGGRTATAASLGVLAVDGLHVPNCRPVAVDLPENVDQAAALMDAYGLKTLYLHVTAVEKLGLPGYDVRKPGGVSAALPHPWADPTGQGPLAEVIQRGLAPWMTLVTRDGQRLNLCIPEYENRMAKPGGRHGISGPREGAVLLDALMVYLLSTVHGPAGRPKVVPYYFSPNKTGEDYAGGLYRTDVTCEAVRRGEVAPLALNLSPTVPLSWVRPEGPNEFERAAAWLHAYDKSAAWLPAWGSTALGIGEPIHAFAEDGVQFDPALPGLWRIASPPGPGPEGLPPFVWCEAEEGGYWVRSTPSMTIVQQVYPGWVPEVLEAYYWPERKRALHGAYELLAIGRTRILADEEAGRPGAVFARAINGSVYKSFRGYLERKKPKRDHVTGELYERDIYYRPDWAWALMDAAVANTYRNVLDYAVNDHMLPLTVYVDAVTYASNTADPIAARPASMKLGATGGGWKPEGSAPMAALLPTIDGSETRSGVDARAALRKFLKGEIVNG
ncbi:DUF927 domain-containing protein [Bacillus subtilis]